MIQSKFVNDILDLLLDGDEKGLALRKQIPFLTDSEYEYTGGGVFVTFAHSEGIKQFMVSMEGTFMDGVEIKSNELEIGAEGILFCKDGLIDFLEIWCYSGDYPKKDLTQYILTNTWRGAPNRQISRP